MKKILFIPFMFVCVMHTSGQTLPLDSTLWKVTEVKKRGKTLKMKFTTFTRSEYGDPMAAYNEGIPRSVQLRIIRKKIFPHLLQRERHIYNLVGKCFPTDPHTWRKMDTVKPEKCY